jgi:predicted N-acyltransferase
LKTRVFNSISDIPKDTWNGLLEGHSCSFAHEFWEVLEASRLNDFQYRYALFFDESDRPVGLATFYTITTDIALFAPGWLRTPLEWVRRVFPGFLKLRMLECGTPVTLNSPPFVFTQGVAEQDMADAVHRLLSDIARREGHPFVVIRDFEPEAEAFNPCFRQRGYHWTDNLPNTYMDIRWPTPEAYLGSLKSYYRSKLLRHLRINAAQRVRHALVEDFAPLAETLCAQWLTVHHQADEFKREVLTPEFYREFSNRLGSRSQALLIYRGDELAAHALLLVDGDLLRWLYFGRNEARNDSLYIYAGHQVVETAIRLGAKRLELGLTTYSVKQDLGADMVPLKMALRSTWRIINPFVGPVYSLLNHSPQINKKNIFKNKTH